MTKLIAVVGPTGTGKSDTGIAIAKHIESLGGRAEIINSDSMQFYRGMNIGTATLTEAERGGIPHHLLDWLEITDESTAVNRDAGILAFGLVSEEVVVGLAVIV